MYLSIRKKRAGAMIRAPSLELRIRIRGDSRYSGSFETAAKDHRDHRTEILLVDLHIFGKDSHYRGSLEYKWGCEESWPYALGSM
jgi:hypothetical protein